MRFRLAPLVNPDKFRELLVEYADRPLRELLSRAPALSTAPMGEETLGRAVGDLRIDVVSVTADTPLFRPSGLVVTNGGEPRPAEPLVPPPVSAAPVPTPELPTAHPTELGPQRAVEIAWGHEALSIASFLRARLSVLVVCEKPAVPHLVTAIFRHATVPFGDGGSRRLQPVMLEVPAGGESPLGPSRAQQQLDFFRGLIENLKDDQVLVLPHLDLLAGGGERGLSREAREVVELIHRKEQALMLGFVDPALPVPDTVGGRFSVRISVSGLPREVPAPGGKALPIGVALVTRAESSLFQDYDPVALYKSVAGLTPLRLRDAMAYAVRRALDLGYGPAKPAPFGELVQQIRSFKAQGSEQFDIPNVSFDQIGGYEEVKSTLRKALVVMRGAAGLPKDALRHELIPRGFLFHGPPGTGKTLFAKAIATELDGTIRIVSGPEITDKYVGESERKVRELFAEARRNAPSVLVFDEFDAIAARRSGRDDGGSRAGNAIVAQILTEMDGFRPDVPMLVIGTTNQLGLIDEALLRPSRFSAIRIGLPSREARRHIALIQARHFEVPGPGESFDDALLDLVADATDGMNGDEIRSIFRDACVHRYLEHREVDAHTLGFLVGRVRATRDQARPTGAPRSTQAGTQRPLPSADLVPVTRRGTP